MTWAELKKRLDKEVADDEEVWYIDVNFLSGQDSEDGSVFCNHHDYGVTVEN